MTKHIWFLPKWHGQLHGNEKYSNEDIIDKELDLKALNLRLKTILILFSKNRFVLTNVEFFGKPQTNTSYVRLLIALSPEDL